MNNTNHLNLASPWTWAVPVLAVSGLITVWLSASNESLFLWLNSLGQGQVGALFWANTTILGDTLLALALLSLFVRRRPEVIWALLIAAVFATFWVHGLKPFFGHPRPPAVIPGDIINIIGVRLGGNSFPSGHTTTAFVLAGVICHMRIHALLSWIALLLATLAGISRAVVGAHWPMDILAGAFGGWITAFIGVLLFQQLATRKQWGTEIPGQPVFQAGLVMIAVSLFFYDNGYPASLPFQYAVATIALVVIIYNLWQTLQAREQSAVKNEQD